MQNETEQMLIGSLILKPDNFFSVADIVSVEDFASRPAVLCFQAIQEMIAAKKPINIASLFHVTGDPTWVGTATDVPGIVVSHIHLAEKVAEGGKVRRIEKMLAQAKNTLRDFGSDMALQEIQKIYKDETGKKIKGDDIVSVVSRFKDVVAENKQRGSVGIPTGFDNLEKDHIAYQQGHLWVIGAWTSTGKTAWAVEAIKRVFWHNNPTVAIFSTEMTEEQNIARLLANMSTVSSHKILGGRLDDAAIEHVEKKQRWIESRRFHVYDQVRNVSDLSNQCRKIVLQHGKLDVVFIDFIQNIRKKGCSSTYEMMKEIAVDLQDLAKELRCCIVCLSQIPTGAAKEDAGILEFKGAGEIAAAADLGVLLKKDKNHEGVLLWETRKNRHGKCGKFLLQFSDNWTNLQEI